MKRFLYLLTGMIVAVAICVGLTWLLGAFVGPLYQGEDESTRNFKIFLVVFVIFIFSGGFISNRLYKRIKKNLK